MPLKHRQPHTLDHFLLRSGNAARMAACVVAAAAMFAASPAAKDALPPGPTAVDKMWHFGAMPQADDNPVTATKVELGKALFSTHACQRMAASPVLRATTLPWGGLMG